MRIIAIALGALFALAAGERAQAETLKAFLERHFASVGTTCLGGLPQPGGRGFSFGSRDAVRSYLPGEITRWSVLRGHLDQEVEVEDDQSINAVFAEVFSQAGSAQPTPLTAQRVGVTWDPEGPSDPILYRQGSNARREHNCVTLLGGDAEMTANLPVASLRAALTATTSNETTQTLFLYAGVMVSPIAAALNLNTTAVDAPAGVSPFAARLAIWHWYREHEHLIPAPSPTPSSRLVIRNQVHGVALYEITGLTQSMLLRATGGGGLALPMFGARAEASASSNGRVRDLRREYSVAFWPSAPDDFVPLPSPRAVVEAVQASAVFTPVVPADLAVSGDGPIPFSADLADVPTNYCNSTFWDLDRSVAQATDAAGAPVLGQVDNLRVALTPGGAPGQCRFTVDVTPPASDDDRPTMGVIIAVKTRLPAAANDQLESIVLRAPGVNVPDFRADIVVMPGDIPAVVPFPATGQPAPVTARFRIHIRSDRKVTGLGGSTSVALNCGGISSPLLLTGGAATLSDGNEIINLQIALPETAIPAAPSSGVSCSLGGQVTLIVKGGSTSVSVALPTQTFTATRAAAAPTPASSATGGGGG